jgi:hypothetical protein
MRRLLRGWLALLTPFLASLIGIDAQDKESLRLVQTIPMPNVKGRIDHMDVKCPGTLFVFVPALSKVQVVNTKKREVIFIWPV